MRPPRFGVAPLQGLAVAVEEQQARREVGALAQLAGGAAPGRADRSRRCGCRRRRRAARPSRRGCRRSSASGRRAAAAARCRPRRSPCPRARASAVPRPAPDRPVTTTNGRRVSRLARVWSRSPGCRAWPTTHDHASAICAKARRNFAAGGGFERRQCNDRQIDLQERLACGLGQALDSLRRRRDRPAGRRRRVSPTDHGRASRCRARAPRSGRRCVPAAVAIRLLALAASSVWSSATRRQPVSIRRSARSDLPAPEGPRSSTARQRLPGARRRRSRGQRQARVHRSLALMASPGRRWMA